MPPRASQVERDLSALNRLADELFSLVRAEFVSDPTVTLYLDRSDRLVGGHADPERDVVNATLLCAQLLRRATAEPGRADPRQVLGLADFLDQLVATLLSVRVDDGSVPPSCGRFTSTLESRR